MISVFVEFVSFWSGMVTCVILLYYIEVGYNITFYILLLVRHNEASKKCRTFAKIFISRLFDFFSFLSVRMDYMFESFKSNGLKLLDGAVFDWDILQFV